MSENSLNKTKAKTARRLGGVAHRSLHQTKRNNKMKRAYDWRMLFVLPAWVFTAFIMSQLIVVGAMQLVEVFGLSLDALMRPAVLQTVVAATVYVLATAMTILVPYALWQRKTSLRVLGMDQLPSWTDIGLAPVAFFVYLIATTVVMGAVVAFISGFPVDQAQEIGFSTFGSRLDNALAFLTLVVLAPVAEEILFRGYLYGKLKKYIPTIIAAIATSLLFALVHFAWNVGVDVFVLGLVLCALRSLTGSIWAGVLVHMLKNGVAYFILFISPLMGG